MFKERHKIAIDIRGIKALVCGAKERRDRYNVDGVVRPATTSVDPRLSAMFKKVTELVGVEERRDELIKMLSKGDQVSSKNLKIVSIAGLGGLGKTTLAKVVYDKLKIEFKCSAFVSVGQNPDVRKVLKDILFQLDKKKYEDIHDRTRDEKQLIDLLWQFLGKKRYFIVIDDIWDIPTWETIKLALVEDKRGSRIITTTRKFEVAIEAGDVYKLEPLSYENSRRLFYLRIFGNDRNFPEKEEDEVLDKILKKCDGVPLSIITMASLLASKPIDEWSALYRSVGFSHRDNRHVDNTRKILLFSYYDMPSHLRACLLYLSIFPEDYIIDKYTLIWKWIAEGFIHGEQGVRLLELGERYFDELVNRSMIQPFEFGEHGFVDGCRLHDMVFSLIRSMTCEENFVTILEDKHGITPPSIVRRFSHQNGIVDANPKFQMEFTHTRSYIACLCDINIMVPLTSFRVLRVLALEDCEYLEGSDLAHLGILIHLRYLGLDGTRIYELPSEIGALKFLQTLSIEGTSINELPRSIGLLTQLMCLRSDYSTWIPDGIIGKLTSLQELQVGFCGTEEKGVRPLVVELGNLKELRVLRTSIYKMDETLEEALLESICNLRQLNHLGISTACYLGKSSRAPVSSHTLHLRQLSLAGVSFSKLPRWINYSLLRNLSFLSVTVHCMDYQQMRVLGTLPELCSLHLHTESNFIVYGGDGYFPKLKSCQLSTGGMVMFREDKSRAHVMPKLEDLRFEVSVRSCKDLCVHHGQDIPLLPMVINLQIVPSLQKISIIVNCKNATLKEVDEVEKELRHAADSHPNRPILQVKRCNVGSIITFDDYLEWSSVDCRDDIDYHVHVRELYDIGYGFDFSSLGNFPLLEKVIAHINCEGARRLEVEEAEAAMRHVVEVHPNQPALQIERHDVEKMKLADDDAVIEDDGDATEDDQAEDAGGTSGRLG